MRELLLVFVLTFCALLGFWGLLSFCRRPRRDTRHPAKTCHGGGCPSCRELGGYPVRLDKTSPPR